MSAINRERHISPLKAIRELGLSVLAIIFLIATVQGLLIPLKDNVSPQLGVTTDLCLVFCLLLIGAFFAQIIRTFFSMEDQDVYTKYLSLKILFNIALSTFFLIILVWVAYLRGVLNSPFSAVLCTAPVSLVFIAAKTKQNEFLLTRGTTKSQRLTGYLEMAERCSAVIPIILYVLCAIFIELWLAGFFDELANYRIFRFLASFKAGVIKAEQHTVLRETFGYILLSYVAFYGSVISTLATYFSTRRPDDSRVSP